MVAQISELLQMIFGDDPRYLAFRSTVPRTPLSSLGTKPARQLYSRFPLGAGSLLTSLDFITTVRVTSSNGPTRVVYRELRSTVLERPIHFQTGKVHG